MAAEDQKIAVAGAGSIGCYMGGALALAGRKVALLARPRLVKEVKAHGFAIQDLSHDPLEIAPSAFAATDRLATALKGADVILVTVRTRDTEEMAGLIAQHASKEAAVVSLQNGMHNVEMLRSVLGKGARVVAGMVPFNVVQVHDKGAAPLFHRTTSGTTVIGADIPGLAETLNVPASPVHASRDIVPVQWGKLLLNLNNALNALSGLPLATQLGDRRWRTLMADQIAEALQVLKAVGITPAAVEGVPPRLVPHILRLPDILFRAVAGRMLAIDPAARLTMYGDLERGRPPEIDVYQGEIAALAERSGTAVPLTRAVIALVNEAHAAGKGAPHLTPEQVRAAV